MFKTIASLVVIYRLSSGQTQLQLDGAFGQKCAPPLEHTVCKTTTDIATSNPPGFTKCEHDYDCCLCGAIQCGSRAVPCKQLTAGNSGIFGVKSIDIIGDAEGAHIDCTGHESCSESKITAFNVAHLNSVGDMALKNATISITNTGISGNTFTLDCVGMGSCEALKLEILIPSAPNGRCVSRETIPFGQIQCSGQEACKDLELTIRNEGCNRIEFQTLSCLQSDSCLNAKFNLVGDIGINFCDLTGSAATATGLGACFENLQSLICPDPTSCRGTIRTLLNPVQGFGVQCEGMGACYHAQFTLEFNENIAEQVTFLDGFKFIGAGSGADTTIILKNDQREHPILTVGKIECLSPESCDGLTIITGYYVSIHQVICTQNACNDCKVKVHADDVQFVPCDPNQIAVGAPPITTNAISNPPNPTLSETTTTSTTSTSTTSSTSTSSPSYPNGPAVRAVPPPINQAV